MHALQNDPELTLGWLSNAAYEIGTAAHENTSFCLVPEASGVVLNSNWRYDWAVKFGQPSAAYHTGGSFPRILRVFRANPVEGQSEEDRAVELAFRRRSLTTSVLAGRPRDPFTSTRTRMRSPRSSRSACTAPSRASLGVDTGTRHRVGSKCKCTHGNRELRRVKLW